MTQQNSPLLAAMDDLIEELTETIATQRRMAKHEDYVYDKSQEKFWDIRDGTLNGPDAVDASIPLERWRIVIPEPNPGAGRPRQPRMIPPHEDIERVENNQFVEGATWWPGKPLIIHDIFVDVSGIREAPGRRAFNAYRPPPVPKKTVATPSVWIEHAKRLFPDPAEHEQFFNICAHMLQRPDEKCNTAVVLSGTQGIGKDAALEPVKRAVGEWNAKNIDPDELFSTYKPWIQTLMLVIDEVRSHNEDHRASSFYDILKPLTASPPNVLALNDKYVKVRYVMNVMRVFITTNDRAAMFIPENDRRIFLMHSWLPQNWHEAEGRPDYFNQYWAWMNLGGADAVAQWLLDRDISTFNAKSPSPKTAAWQGVASSWEPHEDVMALVLKELGDPAVVMTSELLDGNIEAASFDYRNDMLALIKSPRKLMHRMNQAGYEVFLPPPPDKEWRFVGHKRTIKSRRVFVKRDAFTSVEAARALIRAHGATLAGGAKVIEMSRPENF